MKKGRFWLCPILWDSETGELCPRYYGGFWFVLFDFTIWLHHSMLFLAAFIGYEINESYPIKIYK
jgi:hypothetical protein